MPNPSTRLPVIVESSEKNTETIIAATTVEDSQESDSTEPELPASSEPAAEATVVPEVVAINNSASGTPDPTASTGLGRLEITINADTWADIKDANGERLAYDLLRADRQLSLTGQAPFTVFFGNGHGVEMTFNGEEVDLSSNTRDDNTARFKIGSN